MNEPQGLRSVIRWLEKQKMSQADLSVDLGRSHSVLNQWIKGYSRPSLKGLERLSKRTNIPMERLVRELPERTRQ